MLNKVNTINKDFILDYFPKYSRGVEIGVWMGDFSKKILETVRPTMFYLNDPWEFFPQKPGSWYGGNWATCQEDMDKIKDDVCNYFEIYNNVKIIKDYSYNLFEYITPNELDWTYIDGNHDHQFVLADLNTSKKLIKENGLIIGDDYYPGNDIDLAIRDFIKMNPKYNLEIINNQFILSNGK